jgi:VanZ family protein
MKMNVRTFVWYWVPVIAWVSLIFVASTDLMSGQQTSRFIGPFLHWLIPDISPAMIAAVQLAVRKTAHVTEYAVFAILLLRAFVAGRRRTLSQPWLVLLIAALCAGLDEFHQSFVASRTGSPRDVAIDICGAAVGLVLYVWFTRRKSVPPASAAMA